MDAGSISLVREGKWSRQREEDVQNPVAEGDWVSPRDC